MNVYTYMVIGKRVYGWTKSDELPEKILASFIEKMMCFDSGCQATIEVQKFGKDGCTSATTPICELFRELRVDQLTVVKVTVKTWAGPRGEVQYLIAIT